jgi:hypothetical protein
MARKITKESPYAHITYKAQCPRCETEFTYQFSDARDVMNIGRSVPGHIICDMTVDCPYCNYAVTVPEPSKEEP